MFTNLLKSARLWQAIACFLFVFKSASAFDYGAWIIDPMSWLYSIDTFRDACSDSEQISNALHGYLEMADWSDSAEIGVLAVRFPDSATVPYDSLAGKQLKVANFNTWPDNGIYSDSRYRYVTRDFSEDSMAHGQWPSWRSSAIHRYHPATNSDEYLPEDSSGLDQYKTFWKPGSWCVETKWNGWDSLGLSDPYMPFHFRVTCDAQVDGDQIGTHPVVAYVTWFVHDQWTGWSCPEDSNSDWIKYPPIKILAEDFPTGEFSDLNQPLEFTIDPSPDTARFARYHVWGRTNSDSGWYFDPFHLDSLPYALATSHKFDDARGGRLMVQVEGVHGFRLSKIEIWTEGWDRMVEHYTPAWGDTIASYYRPLYEVNPANFAGWMTDDVTDAYTLPVPHLMKILIDHGMPPFLSSSGVNDNYYTVLDNVGLAHPIQAIERYIYWGDRTCFPASGTSGLNPIWTDTSSTPGYYLELDRVDSTCLDCIDAPNPNDRPRHRTFNGRRSVQCAIDFEQWGWEPYAYVGPSNNASAELANLISLIGTRGYEYLRYWRTNGGGERYTQWLKSRGTTVWHLRQSGRFNFVDSTGDNESCLWSYWAPTRTPSTNEVKLSVWLSVAGDADGVMWFGALGDTDTSGYSGLFDWAADDSGTYLPELQRANFCNTQYVYPTHTYYAAKDVKSEVDAIWPFLESSRFVRNYASSAFETVYGTSDCTWVARDYLRVLPDTSAVDFIHAEYYTDVPAGWTHDNPVTTYVQVARFEQPGNTAEDYWFLVVNRRALVDETRRISVGISNVADSLGTYMIERVLANETAVATSYLDDHGQSSRMFNVILEPASAELIHFYKPDTTTLIITQDTVIHAPAYFNRNIFVLGASLTIEPNLDAVAQPIYLSGQLDTIYTDAHLFFAEGRGITLAGDSASGHNGKLKILGSDSVRIIMESPVDDPDRMWTGIRSIEGGADSIVLRNVDFKTATIALQLQDAGTPTTISNCSFERCSTAVYATGRRNVAIANTAFTANDVGVFISHRTIARLTDCIFLEHSQRAIYAGTGSTLDLKEVTIEDGTGDGGIRSWFADVWMKCCKITDNKGIGMEAVGGSLVIADVDTSGARFGANWFCNNSMEEIVADGPMFVWANEGYNSIYDSASSGAVIWVAFDDLAWPTEWHNNYWNGLVTDSAIWSHLDAIMVDTLSEPLRPDCTPARAAQPGFCYLPPVEDETPFCITSGIKEEVAQEFAAAALSYQDALETTSALCRKFPAINRLLTVTYLAGLDDSIATSYLSNVRDTTTSKDLWHAANVGVALALADEDSTRIDARAIYQQVIDSAGSDIYRKIDGQVGMLMINMREEEADTVDGLTVEELSVFLDSLDVILGQRFAWTEYEITDSVVMYAPMRVDSVINVRGGGVLTILPHPGYHNPTVEFVDYGAIKVWGTDTTKAKGKLYVYGDADSRVALHWEDSTGTRNIYSNRGFIKLRNADLHGDGFVNQSQDLSNSGRTTFQADSCTFEWFDEGVVVRGSDTLSHMRACTLAHLGGSYAYYGTNAGLSLIHADGFVVEECVFESNDGTGIYQAYGDDVLIRNCTIRNGEKYGIFGASTGGGSARLECCTIESNGDTLPELYTIGVQYDLVEGHNTFADSTGPLIKSSDAVYVDIENGENEFNVWGTGKYVQSGDTNDIWDITWNTWSPATPDDSSFYSYLSPTNPAKWTVDSSLAAFLACGESPTSSLNGGSWLVVDDDHATSGTMSMNDESVGNTAFVNDTAPTTPKHRVTAKTEQKTVLNRTEKTSASKHSRKLAKLETLEQHNLQLSEWRAIRNTAGSVRQAMQFVSENRNSEFTPALLGYIAGRAGYATGTQTSKFLGEFADDTKDKSLRLLARRLSLQALAREGKPSEALTGLEELMVTAKEPRDSLLSLIDAMMVYFDYHHVGSLQPKHPEVMVTDPYELVKKSMLLVARLDDPELGTEKQPPTIPTSYALYQNYPNPFNPVTEIRFDIPEAIRVELKIFNILGQEVATLVDDVRNAGAYHILWDGKNAGGLSVASGVYVYQIKTPNFTDAKKMMLIR